MTFTPKAIVCVFLGHRWRASELLETSPTLRCERCGRRQVRGAETHPIDHTALKARRDSTGKPPSIR